MLASGPDLGNFVWFLPLFFFIPPIAWVGPFNNLHVETPLHQLLLGGQTSKREAGREWSQGVEKKERNSFNFSWKHLKWMSLFWGKVVGEFHQPFSHKKNLLETNRTLRKVKDWQTLERESSIKVKRTGGSCSDLLRGAGVLGHWNKPAVYKCCSLVDVDMSRTQANLNMLSILSFLPA